MGFDRFKQTYASYAIVEDLILKLALYFLVKIKSWKSVMRSLHLEDVTIAATTMNIIKA